VLCEPGHHYVQIVHTAIVHSMLCYISYQQFAMTFVGVVSRAAAADGKFEKPALTLYT
jgi:hypothetical protein